MSNPKVFEYAKEIGMTPLALMDKIREWHLPIKSHMAELEPEVLASLKSKMDEERGAAAPKKVAVKKATSSKKAQATPKAAAAVEEAPAAAAAPAKTSSVIRRKASTEAAAPAAKTTKAAATASAETEPTDSSAKAVAQKALEAEMETLKRKEAATATTSQEVATETPKSATPPKTEAVKEAAATTPLTKEPVKTTPSTPVTKEIPPVVKANVGARVISRPKVEVKLAEPVKTEPKTVIARPETKPAVELKLDPSKQTAVKVETPRAEGAVRVIETPLRDNHDHAGPARKKEVIVGASGHASRATPANVVTRKNIIGRMDLNRVSNPNHQPRQQSSGGFNSGGQQGSGGGSGFSGPRPQNAGGSTFPRSNPRNLRTGFVSQAPIIPEVPPEDDEFSRRSKFEDKKAKPRFATAEPLTPKEKQTEEDMSSFNATEFRKREMVFQPKKKKGLLNRESLQTVITQPKAHKRVVKVNQSMKLSDLAMEMGVKAAQLVKVCMKQGVMANMNSVLDFDTIALLIPELGFEALNVHKTDTELVKEFAYGDLNAEKVTRPPVVTVMGHVDHGKTSLLDAIRSANVVKGEAGGITQHIGAYSVKIEDGNLITFLDTPGHEAFTAMRARGANVTDIAVIVVAADDGLMPQTAEAINHAKAANVPIIVAINKMDKPSANPERIKQQLTELELVPEEWGGTTIYCPVSAIKKEGIKELLEQINLTAEILELKANPKRSGTGTVIESRLEKGRGPVATILVKDGTVSVGQDIVAGLQRGRIKSLMNDKGERVASVGPGFPVEILGLEGVPAAGDTFDVVKDDDMAEQVINVRKDKIEKAAQPHSKMSLDDLFSKVSKGNLLELPVILKTDVAGSLEAIQGMFKKLDSVEVKIKVIHAAVGGINESDVLLASTSKGIIIGFNVKPDNGALSVSKRMNVEIKTYSIVYELVDDLRKAMTGLLAPDVVEKVMGRAEVRNVFNVMKLGTIAGCSVQDGKVQRNNNVRLIRDGKVVYTGKVGSLKRFKDDAKEVVAGFECGIGIENYNDIKVGDIMETFVKEEIARTLTAQPQA